MADAARADAGTVYLGQPGRRLAAVTYFLLGALYLANLFGFGHPSGWFRVVAGVLVVLVVISAVPQWRAGIYTDGSQLRGRRPLPRRTRSVDWADVDRFELRGYWRGLGARTVTGQWVPLMVYGGFSGQAMEIVHDLEIQRLRQYAAFVDRQSRSVPKVRPHG